MLSGASRTLRAFLVSLLVGQPILAGAIEGHVRNAGPKADLSDFVVFVDDIEGPFPAPEQPAVMEQKELRFVPHVLAIQVGSTVEFPNRDPLSHNVFSISEAKRFNFGLYSRGAARRLRFERPGVVELLCNVHLEMSGYIVVVQNPYFARTGPDGSFRIEGVPAGRHRLRTWHERFPSQQSVTNVPETGTVEVNFALGK